jgi:NitT/TauT family transport system substrate-binding protein
VKRIFILALMLLVSSVQGQARELTFFLTYIPNVQFAPLYVALQQGYFAEAGINLSIEHSFDEASGLERIAINDLQFGVISGEQVIVARSQARPVVFVYNWFQQFPVGIVTPLESGIESVADLRGRRVGIPALSGASYTGLTALLSANEMTLADIQIEPIGFVAPDIVCAGGVDAAVVYLNNEPLEIQRRAGLGECGDVTDVRVFAVSDVGQFVSNGIVTNEETIANEPDLVRAVVSAYDRGSRDAIQNPALAFLMSAEYVEGLLTDDALRAVLETEAEAQAAFLATNPDDEAVAESIQSMRERLGEQFDDTALLQLDVLLATTPLWNAEQTGYSAPEAWSAMQDTLLGMTDPATGSPLLSEAIDLDGAFTNDFLPVLEPSATPEAGGS